MTDRADSPKRARQGAAADDNDANGVDEVAELRALLEAERRARVAAEDARAAAEATAAAEAHARAVEAQARVVAEATAVAEAQARAAESQARAAAEATAVAEARARAAESHARVIAEANAIAEAQLRATEATEAQARAWLARIVGAGQAFAERIHQGRAHQTRRNASSSISSGSNAPRPAGLTDVDVAIQTLVSLRQPDAAFWSELRPTHASTVDRIAARLIADTSVRDKLAAVAAHRASGAGGKEIELVHPLAHAVFSIVAEELALPDIHLYLEKKRGDDRVAVDDALTRHPDVLFYRHRGGAVTEFNSCVQRSGVFSVELKSRLSSTHVNEAVVELLRDYTHTVDDGVSPTAPTFYALLGDGVEWVATRWQCVVSAYYKAFALQQSARFQFDITDATAIRPFVDNVVRLLCAAVASPTHPTGWTLAPLDVAAGNRITAQRVLAATSACVVVQCSDASGSTFALKVPLPAQPERCEKEMAVRSRWLAEGLVPPNIAVCSAVSFFGAPAIRLDTVGDVLERVCLCSAAERESVARVVLRDVGAALDWLHARNAAFVDLHPGNVILVGAGAARQAYLIDAESCGALGATSEAPVRPAFRTLGADQVPTVETDRLGLMLVLAWVLDVQHFRSGVARLESREAGEAEACDLRERYASLEAFVGAHLR